MTIMCNEQICVISMMPSSETVETGLNRLSIVFLVDLIIKISTQKSKVEKVQGGSLKIFEFSKFLT